MSQPAYVNDATPSTNLYSIRQARSLNRKQIAIFCVTIAVACGLIQASYHWFNVTRFLQATDDAYIGGDVTIMSSKVAGYIADVVVTDNQSVHAGDLLIRLDDRDYRAALAKATAAVAAQQAALANFEARHHLQEAVIDQAKASVSAADAETIRAHDDQVRYQNLSARGLVSIQSAQKVDTDYKQALANNEKSQAALSAAQRELEVIDTQQLEIKAALEQAVAESDTARLNLSYTEVRSPIDGVVGNRRAHAGAYTGVGAQLLSIVPDKGLWVDANFKESQLVHIQPGMTATVEIDVLPNQIFHGHVISIAPATGSQFSVLPVENATGNFTKIVQRVPVRIQLDDEKLLLGNLRPGLSVKASVDQRLVASNI
jgi:membrane fusion protein (multidrug efflux system)